MWDKMSKPNIIVSSCLLGNKVRFDGGHKRNQTLLKLKDHVNLIPICPEMDMGMGSPRKTLRLEEGHLIDSSGVDWSKEGEAQMDRYHASIDWENIHGMILMKKSPSCGFERVKQYKFGGKQSFAMGKGFFAERLRNAYPDIPFLDSGRLESEYCRNHFFIQLYSYHRFGKIERTVSSLQKFHREHKYLLMDKCQVGLKQLGQLVANSHKETIEDNFQDYKSLFSKTLRRQDLSQRKLNTLYHLMGYLKRDLPREDKDFLLKLFSECQENTSRINELEKLIHFLVNKFKISYLLEQNYFEPYPQTLRA